LQPPNGLRPAPRSGREPVGAKRPHALCGVPAAGEKQARKRKTVIVQNQLPKRADRASELQANIAQPKGVSAGHSQPSGAPWNDGKRSFSTKERLPVWTKKEGKEPIFREKDIFYAISG